MKLVTAKNFRSSSVAFTTACALALFLGSTSAVAAFVDRDHSAASVTRTDMDVEKTYSRVPQPGIFIDHDHSADGASPPVRPYPAKGGEVMGGIFLDWDHAPESAGS